MPSNSAAQADALRTRRALQMSAGARGWLRTLGMRMKVRAPQTPRELFELLDQLFPGFGADAEEGHSSGRGDELTFHAILMDFAPFFARHVTSFTEKQLKALAEIVNVAAESAGPLANAFDTCFFEGLRRPPVAKVLRPFLSAKAKDLSHA